MRHTAARIPKLTPTNDKRLVRQDPAEIAAAAEAAAARQETIYGGGGNLGALTLGWVDADQTGSPPGALDIGGGRGVDSEENPGAGGAGGEGGQDEEGELQRARERLRERWDGGRDIGVGGVTGNTGGRERSTSSSSFYPITMGAKAEEKVRRPFQMYAQSYRSLVPCQQDTLVRANAYCFCTDGRAVGTLVGLRVGGDS